MANQVTEPTLISNSRLEAVATCSTKAWLSYYQKLTTANDRKETRAGHDGHLALAVWNRTRSKGAVLEVFDHHYRKWSEENVPPEDKWSWENVRRTLGRWCDSPPEILKQAVVIEDLVEYTFVVPWGGRIAVGTLDWVIEWNGGLWIVDHKFTGGLTDYWAKKWSSASQLSMYCWGASKALGRPILGAFVNGLGVRVVPSSTRKCKEHGVAYTECGDLHIELRWLGPYQRDMGWLAEWEADADYLATCWETLIERAPTLGDIGGIMQEGRFNGACRFCEFEGICQTGRQPALIHSTLVQRDMDPSEAAYRAQRGGVQP
jgi:hypothetical protein